MGEIRTLEQDQPGLPRLPMVDAGQGLQPIAVGAVGACVVSPCLEGPAVEGMYTAFTIPEMSVNSPDIQ